MRVFGLLRKRYWVLSILMISLLFVTSCSTVSDTVNPFEQAMSSGKPTIAEFGRGTCIPCKQMKPILEELAIEYKDKLNVVIISVDEYRDLTNQYRIMAIPTQIFFDSSGNELIRHIGFLPKEDIVTQLKKMGVD